MSIHQIFQLVCSTISAFFVVTIVVAKVISWIKLKALDKKTRNEKIAKEKRKLAYLALKEEFENEISHK